MSKRRAVWVQWTDACHLMPGAWVERIPADTSVTVNTVGVLVRRTGTHLVVAQSVDDQGNMTGVFSIPRANVLRVVKLKD